jgi:hypothetical protein
MSKEEYEDPEEILDENDIIDPEEIAVQKKKKLKTMKRNMIEFEDKQDNYSEFDITENIEEYKPLEDD